KNSITTIYLHDDITISQELINLSENKRLGISISEDEKKLIKKYEINVHASYVYTVKIWNNICKKVDYRKNGKLLYGGVQISANRSEEHTSELQSRGNLV